MDKCLMCQSPWRNRQSQYVRANLVVWKCLVSFCCDCLQSKSKIIKETAFIRRIKAAHTDGWPSVIRLFAFEQSADCKMLCSDYILVFVALSESEHVHFGNSSTKSCWLADRVKNEWMVDDVEGGADLQKQPIFYLYLITNLPWKTWPATHQINN